MRDASHPGAGEPDELHEPRDARREEGHEQVEGADPEPHPALEVGLVLVVGPVPLLQDVPALPAWGTLYSGTLTPILFRVNQVFLDPGPRADRGRTD
jgi:hypothetical protein